MKKVWLAILVLCFSTAACVSQDSANSTKNLDDAVKDYTQLGLNYLSSGQRAQARFNILRALEIAPQDAGANHAMALITQSEGELELAEAYFKKALSSEPQFTQARMNYSSFLYLSDRYQESAIQYQRVIDNVNYRLRPQAFTGLALSQVKLGKTEEAKASLRRALMLNPRLTSAILEFAKLSFEQREYIDALEYLERYEDLGSQSADSLWLGIQLSRVFDEPIKEKSYAMALQNIYPESRQARQYKLEQSQ